MRGDVKEAGDRMLAAIKGHVARAVGGLAERLDAFERQLNEFPVPTNGRDGIDGKDGRDGIDGHAVQGPHGDRGEKGDPGRDGVDGKNGIDGQGIAGERGEKGDPGIGKDGRDGDPGRDAAQLEILPAIDETRSYPRGTYATHDGGLWRSFETTIGVRGWENIVRGIADLEFAQDEHDFRKLTLTARLSGAMTKTFALRMDAPLFLGVFKDGVEYRRGDLVQQGGNVWHANRMTKERPIGSGDAWTMMARKGNDGRDGKDGRDGDKGETGPRGKDLTQTDGVRKW